MSDRVDVQIYLNILFHIFKFLLLIKYIELLYKLITSSHVDNIDRDPKAIFL